LNCKQTFIGKSTRKFCSPTCYRQHKAKVFGNTEYEFIKPEDYEKFLGQELMPCLVKGCHWEGRFVSAHMVAAHGIPAREVKRECGFNLTQGLMTPSLRKKFSERPNTGIAKMEGEEREDHVIFLSELRSRERKTSDYTSCQQKEHAKKEHKKRKQKQIRGDIDAPHGVCRTCGKEFVHKNGMFFAGNYCSLHCRSEFYKKNTDEGNFCSGKKSKSNTIVCSTCGKEFQGKRSQIIRFNKGLPVACGIKCRQNRNGKIAGEHHKSRCDYTYSLCLNCGKECVSTPSKQRKYCSYSCCVEHKRIIKGQL
jgi:hypothetical protein